MSKKGYKQSEDHKRKIGESNSISLLGNIPWNKGKSGYSTSQKGKKRPDISKRMMGEKNPMFGKNMEQHPRWTGNTTLNKNIRNSDTYVGWRESVFERDDFTCQSCGKRGIWIKAHHKKSLASLLEENNICSTTDAEYCNALWDISNGIILCESCHIIETFGEYK